VSGRDLVIWSRQGGLCDTVGKTGLLVHSLGDGDVNLLSIIEVCTDLISNFALGELDIVLGGTFAGHQTEKSLVNVNLPISLAPQKTQWREGIVPIGIQCEKHWGRPCCEWRDRDLRISFE